MQLDLMTFAPSERTTSRPSISSAVDSPVRILATLARGLASQALAAVYGSSSRESLANYDRASSSWRTSQLSLTGDSIGSLATFPKAGMTRSGSLYALPTLERHTGASGCSSSGGVDAGMAGMAVQMLGRQAVRDWPTPVANPDAPNLNSNTVNGPTSLGEAARLWATPTREGFDAQGHRGALDSEPTGSLSPDWVSQLLGFPDGWTEAGLPAPAKRSTPGKRRASRKASRTGKRGSGR